MAFANLGKDRVRSLPLSQIMVNRHSLAPASRMRRCSSWRKALSANGLLQPVTVREAGPGKYQW